MDDVELSDVGGVDVNAPDQIDVDTPDEINVEDPDSVELEGSDTDVDMGGNVEFGNGASAAELAAIADSVDGNVSDSAAETVEINADNIEAATDSIETSSDRAASESDNVEIGNVGEARVADTESIGVEGSINEQAAGGIDSIETDSTEFQNISDSNIREMDGDGMLDDAAAAALGSTIASAVVGGVGDKLDGKIDARDGEVELEDATIEKPEIDTMSGVNVDRADITPDSAAIDGKVNAQSEPTKPADDLRRDAQEVKVVENNSDQKQNVIVENDDNIKDVEVTVGRDGGVAAPQSVDPSSKDGHLGGISIGEMTRLLGGATSAAIKGETSEFVDALDKVANTRTSGSNAHRMTVTEAVNNGRVNPYAQNVGRGGTGYGRDNEPSDFERRAERRDRMREEENLRYTREMVELLRRGGGAGYR